MNEEPPRKKLVLDLDWFPEPIVRPAARVRILPADRWITLEPGESIFEGAKRVGIAVPTECGGKGTCGRCRIQCASPAPEPSPVERRLLDRAELGRGIRLACRTRPASDLTVTVLPDRAGRR
ncbi:MAG: 2Fe-2S iron-sulfur cluster-binding protein [Chloroflexota bacterium]